ncbi:MAG: hypothetical protein ACRD3Q_02680, partial [Terriglobales bacterium]
MSIPQLDNTPRCRHVYLSGRACKAPARRGTPWCLFHAAEHNEAPLPFSTLDDAAGIHAAAGQVLFDLQREIIDLRRASLMFSGLRLMRANLKQLAYELGDPLPEPRKLTKEERLDAELASQPSLAEVLIERLNQLEADDARAEGRPVEPVIDLEKAKSEGADLAQVLLDGLHSL